MKEIIIDGMIGWMIDGEFMRRALESANGEDVTIKIASEGGSVYEGIKIFNYIKEYSGKVHVHIFGLAASMASYIALAGDTISATSNSIFMIHNVWSYVAGNHKELREIADVFEGLSNILANTYSAKTKKNLDDIKSMMDNDTYLFGEEILNAGFIDEIIQVDSKDEKDDSVAVAKLSVKECFAKLKNEKIKEEDFEKVAAIIKNLNPISKKESLPAKGAGENKNNDGGKSMTLDELKAKDPELYNQIFNSGIEAGKKAERERVSAHLKLGKASGATDKMYEYIESGESLQNESVLAEYQSAALNRKDLNNVNDDNADDQDPPAGDGDNVESIKAFENGMKGGIDIDNAGVEQ